MGDSPLVSVVLPAYNEIENLEQTVLKVERALEKLERFEVIIVDDGSTDGTKERADRLQERTRVTAIHHPYNRGYGAALRSGFKHAQGRYLFMMDADGQFDPQEFWALWERRNEADAVLGYRLQRKDPWLRRANAFGWNQLNRVMFGLRVQDIDCAFKLLPKAFVQRAALCSDGATINVEMLVKFMRLGATWIEVGVHHYPRLHGQATGADPRVIVRAFRELIELKKVLADFTPVSEPIGPR
ncbi:MAG: glycosyltransferase family 2 protein [Firmicutes bacterium]|nr:glycosyltransferase family 2 protein [Bacillota bacterium]